MIPYSSPTDHAVIVFGHLRTFHPVTQVNLFSILIYLTGEDGVEWSGVTVPARYSNYDEVTFKCMFSRGVIAALPGAEASATQNSFLSHRLSRAHPFFPRTEN